MLALHGHLLKLPIFVVEKAATPKNMVEFFQKCIGAIRFSLATLCGNIGLDLVESTFLLFCFPSNLSLSKTTTNLLVGQDGLYHGNNNNNKLGLSCAKLRASLDLLCYDRLILFVFTNKAYEFDFGAVILSLWKVLFGSFGLVW